MKSSKLTFVTILVCLSFSGYAQETVHDKTRETENIKCFAKLYGYVRYFHPADEASKIDWDKFAVYGIKEVEKAKDNGELLLTLKKLFKPIAPSVLIDAGKDSLAFDVKSVTPDTLKKYEEIYWQHLGLGEAKRGSIYWSMRVNRKRAIRETNEVANAYCSLVKTIDASNYKGKEFEYKAYAKNNNNNVSNGYLWVRIDQSISGKENSLFFDNMADRPIIGDTWKQYTIKGKIDSLSKVISFGAYTKAGGNLLVDKMEFYVKNEKGELEEIYSNDFEKDDAYALPSDVVKGIGIANLGKAGTCIVNDKDVFEGKKCVMLSSNKNKQEVMYQPKPLFDFKPFIDKPFYSYLRNNISCVVPLDLYGTSTQTYPAGDTTLFKDLISKLNDQNTLNNSDRYVQIAALMVLYNGMQHFFPYFDVVNTNWDDDFTNALNGEYVCKNKDEFNLVLKKFTAKLHDGHVRISGISRQTNLDYFPPFTWEWIENKLVITKVFDGTSLLVVGSVVSRINNTDARSYFDSTAQYIAAATKGFLDYRLNKETLYGDESSGITLDITLPGGIRKSITMTRELSADKYYDLTTNKVKAKKLDDSTYYLNIDQISKKEIDSLMPELKKAKTIICDLRGYPNSNHDFISHLLTIDDTCKRWMQIPEIIYPDYKVSGFENAGWRMKRTKPHLKAKIIFITNGRAISYAESYIGFIQGYKLATIIGQPTAGTNGNVNTILLPGGYRVSFTGMKVLKQDGSQLHGIGFIPDVLVNITIKGVVEGRDEFLDKAIELSKQ